MSWLVDAQRREFRLRGIRARAALRAAPPLAPGPQLEPLATLPATLDAPPGIHTAAAAPAGILDPPPRRRATMGGNVTGTPEKQKEEPAESGAGEGRYVEHATPDTEPGENGGYPEEAAGSTTAPAGVAPRE